MQEDYLSAYYNNRIAYFCSKTCSKNYEIEYLNCNECGKYVKSSKKVTSICCDTCNFWIHKRCSGLNNDYFTILKNTEEGWDCKKCKQDMFPFFNLNGNQISKLLNGKDNYKPPHKNHNKTGVSVECNNCLITSNTTNGWYYAQCTSTDVCSTFCTKTCLDIFAEKNPNNYEIYNCSICSNKIGKKVDSIFCDICFTWVHRKCIPNLSHAEYESLSNINSDWFCPPCQDNIFPFHKLDDDEFIFHCNKVYIVLSSG